MPAALTKMIKGMLSWTHMAKDTEEKVRVLHRWICANISYDCEGHFSSNKADQSPAAVLHSRTAVSAGYANLLSALCKEVGKCLLCQTAQWLFCNPDGSERRLRPPAQCLVQGAVSAGSAQNKWAAKVSERPAAPTCSQAGCKPVSSPAYLCCLTSAAFTVPPCLCYISAASPIAVADDNDSDGDQQPMGNNENDNDSDEQPTGGNESDSDTDEQPTP
eukprot:scaffold2260_cov15-Tisochrysis_lutea.AAC.1